MWEAAKKCLWMPTGAANSFAAAAGKCCTKCQYPWKRINMSAPSFNADALHQFKNTI